MVRGAEKSGSRAAALQMHFTMMRDLVVAGGRGPGVPAVRSLIGLDETRLLVRDEPDPGVRGILGSDAGQVVRNRGIQLGPMRAAVGGAQDGSGSADNPAHFSG